MPTLITRREALFQGLKRFYNAHPCKHGHDCERFVSSGACVRCVNFKRDEIVYPAPLEQFTLANGRVVSRLTQEEAHARGWRVFFSGVPCSEGHTAERFVKDGRCVECVHPTKYGPDGYTGWWPFRPKQPFRIPPGTPLTVQETLAARIQKAIPEFLKEIEPELAIVEQCIAEVGGVNVLVEYTGRKDHVWEGHKLWRMCMPRVLEFNLKVEQSACNNTTWWINRDGKWFACVGGEWIPVEHGRTLYEPQRDNSEEHAAPISDADLIAKGYKP